MKRFAMAALASAAGVAVYFVVASPVIGWVTSKVSK